MLEDDIRQLAQKVPERSLEGLEADIWNNVEAKVRLSSAIKRATVYQGMIVAVVLSGGWLTGSLSETPRRNDPLVAFSPSLSLAPSSLLLRGHL